MDDDVRRQAQRRGSNLYAFRRLKWGRPPRRFAADEVMGGTYAELEPVEPTIEALAPRRQQQRAIDVALWIAAASSLAALAWAVARYIGLL